MISIKILGSGCKKCETLYERAEEAAQALQLEATFSKVTDFGEIAQYGVAKTPALVIDEKVALFGRVPEVDELKKLLS